MKTSEAVTDWFGLSYAWEVFWTALVLWFWFAVVVAFAIAALSTLVVTSLVWILIAIESLWENKP